MPFNSLATILAIQHDQRLVAFSSDKTFFFDQFLSDVHSLVITLKRKDCHAVAICCEDSYLFLVAFFAVAYSNKKIVLPGNHQPAMLLSLSSQFDLLINDNLVNGNIVAQNITLPVAQLTSEIVEKKGMQPFSFTALDLSLVNLTLFTSGSTGTPKAIHKTLLMLDAEIQALENQWGLQIGDSHIVSTVSHQHIYGLLFRVLWPLCTGRAFASQDLTYPEQVIANATLNYTLISSPALLKRLVYEGEKGNYCAVFSSGGPLSNEASMTCKQLLSHTAIEVFGSTETGGIGYRQQYRADSPWTFFPEVVAKLGSEYCLALSSPWLSDEMKNVDGYYQSSDQCELLENHQFRLKGRIDRIVKIEEKRISLIDVEKYIDALQWVSESAVIVVNEPHRIALGALLTLSECGEQEIALLGKGRFWIKLRQALRGWVEPVGIPRHFRVASEIPINKQGKRLQQEIAELFK